MTRGKPRIQPAVGRSGSHSKWARRSRLRHHLSCTL